MTTAITLKGAVVNGKATFVPVEQACDSTTPKVVLDENGRGLFTIPSSGAMPSIGRQGDLDGHLYRLRYSAYRHL